MLECVEDGLHNIPQTVSEELDDLDDELEALSNYLTYPMKAKEFLSIPEEDTVYEVPSDDQVIADIVNTFRTTDLTEDFEEDDDDNDDSTTFPTISIKEAITSLESINMYLLQQDDTEEYIKAMKKLKALLEKKINSNATK
ncbi:8078_t:CDS:2 [Gigaspora rosea]|nr:8078_t:CDS:2 [Gigaspora rosea]